jgi:RHS repeat-associated protein
MHTVTNELDEVTTYTYDDQNNLLTVEDNLDNTTTYTHDAKGNLKTITDANRQPVGPGETGAQCGTAGTGDGVDDDADTVEDDGCPSTIYDYDNADRLIDVIDALGNITSYGYDANGNRTSVTNARSKVTTYAYDAHNRLQSVTDPLGRITSYEYDDASNLIERTDARDLFTQYAYDALNRLKDIDYFEFEGGPLVDSVDYTYDDVGNRFTMVDPTGTTEYGYDALNRLTSVTVTPSGPPWPSGDRVVSYQYDNVGDLNRITYPDGKYVDYTYDEAHNIDTVTDWLSKTTTYIYDDAGKPTNVAYPVSGFSLAYGYDLAGRLRQITHNTAILPQVITYTLDAVGNRRSMQVDSQTPTTYQYDSLYRLESVSYPDGASTTYTYDAVGNRLNMFRIGLGSTDYVYDDADQLTEVAGVAYTHDDNGNLKTRGIETYDYDFENRLTRITFNSFDPYSDNPAEFGCNDFNGDGELTIVGDVLLYSGKIGASPPDPDFDPLLDINNDLSLTVVGDVLWFVGKIGETCPRKFSYNGDGLRVTSELGRFWTDYAWDVAAGLPVVLQETYREKTMLPQETRYIKTYVYGLDLISVYTDDLEHETTAQDYYFPDGLGSTVILARDSESNEAAEWTYDAFGEVRTQSGTLSTDFLFTGEQFDAKARPGQGLYYLRARYYDPTIGRFLTRDPFPGIADQPQTLNAYVYALNHPTLLADPTGLFSLGDVWEKAKDIGKPAADYVVDKTQDIGQYTVRRFYSPHTTFQDTVALGISLFSVGDRKAGPFGFTYYENCRGACDLIADHLLGGTPAFNPGYIGFAEGKLWPGQVYHEAQHYLQSMLLGPFYLPLTLEEWARSTFYCGTNSACVHRISVIETDAARARQDKELHFPFWR